MALLLLLAGLSRPVRPPHALAPLYPPPAAAWAPQHMACGDGMRPWRPTQRVSGSGLEGGALTRCGLHP